MCTLYFKIVEESYRYFRQNNNNFFTTRLICCGDQQPPGRKVLPDDCPALHTYIIPTIQTMPSALPTKLTSGVEPGPFLTGSGGQKILHKFKFKK